MIKVLLIEDNKLVRVNTKNILELADYDVVTAENGKIGVEIAKNLLPDIIVCDIMMPELDGYEVLQALKENSKTASVPFIFLTSQSEKAEMRKGMNLGADDYLTKPFNENELLEAIESRLMKRSLLKKELTRNIEETSQFIKAASTYMDLNHLARDYSPQKYNKMDLIFREGRIANFIYFIESGTVKTYKTTEKGKEFVTGLHNAGQFIGQLSLLSDNGTYIESASVLEESVLYVIPKLDFNTLIHGNKEVANKFVGLISNNLVDLQEKLMNLAFTTVRQRVARALLDIHNKGILTNNKDNSISITRDDFAGLIGSATETAIRMLSDFKNEGIITIGNNSEIVVKDKKVLERIVTFG